jgi:hypothetical protein
VGAKGRIWAWLGVLALLGVLGAFMSTVDIATDYAYYCQDTGSRHGYRVWWNGARTRVWYRASPLEEFMKKEYPRVRGGNWMVYAATGKNFLGQPVMFTDFRAVSGAFFLKDEAARAWIAHHSKAEVRALYDSLAASNPTSADAIVKKINDEVATYKH